MSVPAGYAEPPRDPRPGAPFTEIYLPLLARLVAGGVFVWAASVKLGDPQSFFEAVRAFKIIRSEQPLLFITHTLPWIELFAGLALVLGFWTRAAAFIIACLLAGFIAAILSVLARGLDVHCGCFGRLRLVCEGPIGWCKVGENTVLTVIALIPLRLGGGRYSIDAAIERKPL